MKKKKKLLLKHEVVLWAESDVGEITVTKHSDMKTGVTLYSIDLNGEPCVTCDNLYFLGAIITNDTNFIGNQLCDILDSRCMTSSIFESEE